MRRPTFVCALAILVSGAACKPPASARSPDAREPEPTAPEPTAPVTARDDGGGDGETPTPPEPKPVPRTCGGAPLTVTFYDAGQALSALVTLPDARRILVDVGESPTRAGCKRDVCGAWSQRVVQGVTEDLEGHVVDLLWITHQHSDHHGGLRALADAGLRVANYVDNGTRADARGVIEARTAATAAGAKLHEVYPGHTTLPIRGSGDVRIEAVVPPKWPVRSCERDDAINECSIGLKVTYCDSVVLFTGDAGEAAEKVWPVGDVSLLQVGHHGSNTSTKQAFIDTVRPEYAVISSAKRDEGTNRTYCHPILETVDRVTRATGGPGSRRVEVFDAKTHRCKQQTPDDWKTVPVSDRLWITAVDGEVSLVTTGDGVFRKRS